MVDKWDYGSVNPDITYDPVVTLRPVDKGDCDWIFLHRNSEYVRENCRNPDPILKADHDRWFENLPKSATQAWRIDDKDKKRVGVILLTQIKARPLSCEISLWIASQHEGLGYATRAIASMAQYAEYRKYTELTAEILGHNMKSLSAFLKNGFMVQGHTAMRFPGRDTPIAMFSMVKYLRGYGGT